MTRAGAQAVGLESVALEDRTSVLELAQELVRIPSRGGIDPYDPVLDCMASWLDAHGLECRRLTGPGGATVALACEVTGAAPGPRYVLDACLDTAPFGDTSAWRLSPTSGVATDGWLHGRGSSDSKAGAAIFAHIVARLKSAGSRWAGSVVLLLDVDEHTGAFGGAKAFFEEPGAPRVDGVMIGYPGPDHVVTGGRGVLRARLHVHGIAGHSGSASTVTQSAIAKAATLVTQLDTLELPGPPGPGFPLPGRLTVTAISGGEGYSVVPDLCVVNVDVRLTPPSTPRRRSTRYGRPLPRPTKAGRARNRRTWRSPPPGPRTRCPGTRPCGRPCCPPPATWASPPGPRSQGRRISATIWQGSESPRPPGSASPTRDCTAQTSASASTPYRPSRPPTTRRCSPCCRQCDQVVVSCADRTTQARQQLPASRRAGRGPSGG